MPFLSSCIIVEYRIEAISPGSGEHAEHRNALRKTLQDQLLVCGVLF